MGLAELNADASALAERIERGMRGVIDTKTCSSFRDEVIALHRLFETEGVVVPDDLLEIPRKVAPTDRALARSRRILNQNTSTLQSLSLLEQAIRPCRRVLWNEHDFKLAEELGSGSSLFELSARWACIRGQVTEDDMCATVDESRRRFIAWVNQVREERDRLQDKESRLRKARDQAKTKAQLLTRAIANVVQYKYGEDKFSMIGFLGGVYNGLCNCACGTILYLAIAEALYGVPEYLSLYRLGHSKEHVSVLCADALDKKCVLQTYETTEKNKKDISTPSFYHALDNPSTFQVLGSSHDEVRSYVAWLHTLSYDKIPLGYQIWLTNAFMRQFGPLSSQPQEQQFFRSKRGTRWVKRQRMQDVRAPALRAVRPWTLPVLRKASNRLKSKKQADELRIATHIDTLLYFADFPRSAREYAANYILSNLKKDLARQVRDKLRNVFGDRNGKIKRAPENAEELLRAALHDVFVEHKRKLAAKFIKPFHMPAIKDVASKISTQEEMVSFLMLSAVDEALKDNGISVGMRSAVASYFIARLGVPMVEVRGMRDQIFRILQNNNLANREKQRRILELLQNALGGEEEKMLLDE